MAGEIAQEYNFTTANQPGGKHQNADALSQLPCTQCGKESHCENVLAAEHQTPTLKEKSPAELRKIQLDDGPVRVMLRAVEKGEQLNSGDVRGQGPDAQSLNQLWSKLMMETGVLKRRYVDTNGTSYIS